MTQISGPARLGKSPVLKTVSVSDDKLPVCELRVKFTNFSKNPEGDDPIDRGFWADVSIWGRFAEPASKLLEKGDRVFVVGDLSEDSFEGRDGDEVRVFKVSSNQVFPWTPDLVDLKYKPRGVEAKEGGK